MASETKAGLAVIVILLCAFGFLMYRKWNPPAEPGPIAQTDDDQMSSPAEDPVVASPEELFGPENSEPEIVATAQSGSDDWGSIDDPQPRELAPTPPADVTPQNQTEPDEFAVTDFDDPAPADQRQSTGTVALGTLDDATDADPFDTQPADDPWQASPQEPQPVAETGQATARTEQPAADPFGDPFDSPPQAELTRPTVSASSAGAEASFKDDEAAVFGDPLPSPGRPESPAVREPDHIAFDQTSPTTATLDDPKPVPVPTTDPFDDPVVVQKERVATPAPTPVDTFGDGVRFDDPEPNGSQPNQQTVRTEPVIRPPVRPTQDVSRTRAVSAPETFDATSGSPRTYVIRRDDTYWAISKRVYNTPRYYLALARYNVERVPDPRRMRPGTELIVPAAGVLEQRNRDLFPPGSPSPAEYASRFQGTRANHEPGLYLDQNDRPYYKVGDADSLSSIAYRYLGRASRWKQIYDMNRDQLGNSPNAIKPGMMLALPSDASEVRRVSRPRSSRVRR